MKRTLPYIALALVMLEIALIMLSWIVNAFDPALPLRSLISSEGLRWFFGTFTYNMSSPLLIWLMLCCVAYGAFAHGGLKATVARLVSRRKLTYRKRYAFFMSTVVMVLMLVILFLLSFVPHAVLLSITGNLFPSTFSNSLIPSLAFIVTLTSIVYGLSSGEIASLSAVFRCLYIGLYVFIPLFPIYIFAVQLYYSFRFVFMG